MPAERDCELARCTGSGPFEACIVFEEDEFLRGCANCHWSSRIRECKCPLSYLCVANSNDRRPYRRGTRCRNRAQGSTPCTGRASARASARTPLAALFSAPARVRILARVPSSAPAPANPQACCRGSPTAIRSCAGVRFPSRPFCRRCRCCVCGCGCSDCGCVRVCAVSALGGLCDYENDRGAGRFANFACTAGGR